MLRRCAGSPATIVFALGCLALVASAVGCRDRASNEPAKLAASSASAPRPQVDFSLGRAAFVAYGGTTAMPLTTELSEPIPALVAPMRRIAGNFPGAAPPLRIGRDVPYGQAFRLFAAGADAGIAAWEVRAGDEDAPVILRRGFGLGPVECFATAWIGPGDSVTIGIGGRGTLVQPTDGRVPSAKAIGVLRALDRCAKGWLRLNAQAGAPIGPVLDFARAVAQAVPPLGARTLELGPPNVAPVDKTYEIVGR